MAAENLYSAGRDHIRVLVQQLGQEQAEPGSRFADRQIDTYLTVTGVVAPFETSKATRYPAASFVLDTVAYVKSPTCVYVDGRPRSSRGTIGAASYTIIASNRQAPPIIGETEAVFRAIDDINPLSQMHRLVNTGSAEVLPPDRRASLIAAIRSIKPANVEPDGFDYIRRPGRY